METVGRSTTFCPFKDPLHNVILEKVKKELKHMRKVPHSSSPGQTHMKNVKEGIKGKGKKSLSNFKWGSVLPGDINTSFGSLTLF